MDEEQPPRPRRGRRLAVLALIWIGVIVVPRLVAGWLEQSGITLPLAEPSLGHVAYDIVTDIDQANAWARERRPLPRWTSVTITVSPVGHDPRATTLSGTSFALARSGGTTVWATNQHMVGPCAKSLSVRFTDREQTASVAMSDEANDLALMWAAGIGPEPLPVSDRLPGLGEEAYLYGYPRAKPGAVAGRLLARANIRHLSSGSRGDALVWVETARSSADMSGSLSGASGSPMIDASGRVVGVMESGETRRGRFQTVALEVLRAAMEAQGLKLAEGTAVPLRSDLDWLQRGLVLLRSGRIRQVICRT